MTIYKDDYFKALLRERNLKATKARLQLLLLISGYDGAIPYSIIQQSLVKIDRITLYRTINSLLNKGIIHRALSTNKDTYYALCDDHCTEINHKHNHIHFKCNVCHTVTCQDIKQDITITIPKFIIDKMNISATGLCYNCSLKS